jgi:hypothetical protein
MRRKATPASEYLCKACGIMKPATEYYSKTGNSLRRQYTCKPCNVERVKAWYRSEKGKAGVPARRLQARLHGHGVTLEWYLQQVEAQHGLCAICQRPDRAHAIRMLCVDHCHETGAVRGLTCRQCNTAIGQMSDNHEVAYRAAKYLHLWAAKRLGGYVQPRPRKQA